jgi:hypothetical protein
MAGIVKAAICQSHDTSDSAWSENIGRMSFSCGNSHRKNKAEYLNNEEKNPP